MTLTKKQAIFALNTSKLIQFIFENNGQVTFGDTYRSSSQALDNAQAGIGIKNSLHCKRLAVDLNLFNEDGKYLTDKKDYEQFGTYWKSLNPDNRWGGDFVTLYHGKIDDPNHFEMQDL